MTLTGRTPTTSWWMTREAWSSLLAEIAQLSAIAADRSGQGGPLLLPVADLERRGRNLVAVRDGAVIEDAPGRAAIGRRVTIREEDGQGASYRLVLPGDGDPARGWISADSPLGCALLGSLVGEQVKVLAPAGPRWVEVVTVD